MMHTHSLGRAARYYPEGAALGSSGRRSTFRQLHDRVAGIAAALSRHGFERGDRLALLLPNEHEYLELVYACSWLGVIGSGERPVHEKIPAADGKSMIDHFHRAIHLDGDLTKEQRLGLLEIAERCPVGQTLRRSSVIDSRLADAAPPIAA